MHVPNNVPVLHRPFHTDDLYLGQWRTVGRRRVELAAWKANMHVLRQLKLLKYLIKVSVWIYMYMYPTTHQVLLAGHITRFLCMPIDE